MCVMCLFMDILRLLHFERSIEDSLILTLILLRLMIDSFLVRCRRMLRHHLPIMRPVSSKVMEIVIPEVGRIEDDILLIKDDTLREKLLNVNRLVAKIEALKDNPVPSSSVVTKSTSTSNLFWGD
ncbi:hypothetical protein Tco_1264994 [Tanacetum coccineum]